MLIQNFHKFSKQNIKFDKIYIFLKIHIYWTMINTKKNMWFTQISIYILNNKLQENFISKKYHMKKCKGLKEDSESFFKGFPLPQYPTDVMKEYLTSAWLRIWLFRAAMAAFKRSFVLCLWFWYEAFRIKKFLKKRRKRDGVRRNWLLRSGREKREIDNG
jgi:hypothetical protein